jgi:hypothetical protein
MRTLYLDIETIPADDRDREKLAYLYARKREKQQKKKVAEPSTGAEDFEQFLLSTSFDGAFGRTPVDAGAPREKGRNDRCGALSGMT